VPGIDFTNDPLLQGRLFSYIDTQLRRVGPNFAELPINRPLDPVHNNQRDGMARTVINKGRVAYFPNRLGGGCPVHSPEAADAFVSYAEKVDGAKIRVRSDSFADHFSQATQFWNSMSDWEQQHIAEAFSFELNQVESEEVRHHVMNELLVNIADALAEAVSTQTGIKVAPLGTPQKPTPSAPTPSGPLRPGAKDLSSPALSQDKPSLTIKGRKIALLGGECGFRRMRTVIPIDCGQRFRSIADSVPVIADSGSRRRLQGLTRRCRCQAFHANPSCRHQLSSRPILWFDRHHPSAPTRTRLVPARAVAVKDGPSSGHRVSGA
jgi:hypothetical protein